MSLVAIKTKIKAKLDAQSGAGKPIGYVYAEHRTDFDGYPAVTFEPSDVEVDYETNTQDLRKYAFRIICWQQMEGLNRADAIDILAGLVDTLLDDFGTDFTLGGTCDYSIIQPLSWGEYVSDVGIVKYAEIKLVCAKSEEII